MAPAFCMQNFPKKGDMEVQMNFEGEKNSAGASPMPESRLPQGKMEVEMNFGGDKSSAGALPLPEVQLPQGKMEVEMNFDGDKILAGAPPVAEVQLPQGNMEVEMNFYRAPLAPEARLPQVRTGPSGIMVYGGIPRGSHLSSSLPPGSLFRWTFVSETHWRNGIIYPRPPYPPRDMVHPLPAPQLWSAGSQASPSLPSSGDVTCVRRSNRGSCQCYFGPNGCRDGYSCRYRPSLQAWLADRQTKGLGGKRKLGERWCFQDSGFYAYGCFLFQETRVMKLFAF